MQITSVVTKVQPQGESVPASAAGLQGTTVTCLFHDLRDERAIPSLVYHRKGWLHTRIRDRTLSSPTLASSMAQIIFPIPASVWLNYHNVAGKTTALQEQRNNGWRKVCPSLCIAQLEPTAQLLAKPGSLVQGKLHSSQHTHKLQPLPWTTAFWVIYIKCWQVFGEGKRTSVFANANNWPDHALVVCS